MSEKKQILTDEETEQLFNILNKIDVDIITNEPNFDTYIFKTVMKDGTEYPVITFQTVSVEEAIKDFNNFLKKTPSKLVKDIDYVNIGKVFAYKNIGKIGVVIETEISEKNHERLIKIIRNIPEVLAIVEDLTGKKLEELTSHELFDAVKNDAIEKTALKKLTELLKDDIKDNDIIHETVLEEVKIPPRGQQH